MSTLSYPATLNLSAPAMAQSPSATPAPPDPPANNATEQPETSSTNNTTTTASASTAPATRSSRKRKSPPTSAEGPPAPLPQPTQSPAPQPATSPPPPHPGHPGLPAHLQHVQHVLPPPHALMHPLPPGYYAHPPPGLQAIPGVLPPGLAGLPAGIQSLVSGDYTAGGMPAPPQGLPQQSPPSQSQPQQIEASSSAANSSNGNGGRQLSNSKRAEQNRKAQRAFRERRDQHVKALESRSQLLDAALASADEANRRWEECRALVDQLRVENAALRAHLAATQAAMAGQQPQGNVSGITAQPPPPQQGTLNPEEKKDGEMEGKDEKE